MRIIFARSKPLRAELDRKRKLGNKSDYWKLPKSAADDDDDPNAGIEKRKTLNQFSWI